MGGFGRRQGASEAQAFPLFGMSYSEDSQGLCLAMGEQPAPVWGQWSCPELLGSPSGHGCKASSLMSCIGGKEPSVCLARLFSHASEAQE